MSTNGCRDYIGQDATPPSPVHYCELTTSIDVIEWDDYYEAVSCLPGIQEDDIVVGLADQLLTIVGKTTAKTAGNIGRILVVDHQARLVEQSFGLPDDIDDQNLEVIFDNDVLKILIGKKAAA